PPAAASRCEIALRIASLAEARGEGIPRVFRRRVTKDKLARPSRVAATCGSRRTSDTCDVNRGIESLSSASRRDFSASHNVKSAHLGRVLTRESQIDALSGRSPRYGFWRTRVESWKIRGGGFLKQNSGMRQNLF